jgi:hypothetical protein
LINHRLSTVLGGGGKIEPISGIAHSHQKLQGNCYLYLNSYLSISIESTGLVSLILAEDQA